MKFSRVKVFSATKARDRSELGEKITEFLSKYLGNGGRIIDKVVTQSSDQEFHCLTVILFLQDGVG